MSKFKRLMIVLSLIILTIPIISSVYAIDKLTLISKSINTKSNKSSGVYNTKKEDSDIIEYKDVKGITNVLLVGKDSTEKIGRSDTMIILTIDDINKSLKLTSLARDTLVDIPGRGEEKLTHAYAYGGIDLLIKTINENFNLDIKNYAQVDFKSFIEVIDILGGVEVAVNEKELEHLNRVINSCYNYSENNNEKIEYIESSGSQNLNGYQALAYARMRKIDTIYNRDERQRAVLESLAIKLSETPITTYPSIIKTVLSYVNVNIAPKEIMNLAFIAHELASYDIQQLEFPVSEYREDGILIGSKAWVIKWDKDKNLDILHNFIYR